MNVEHPDDLEEVRAEDENAQASDNSKQAQNAPTQAAPLMERSVSNPIIINK